MNQVYLILALHNHQPVGNFNHVFEEACSRAYQPFLETLEKYPRIRIVVHYSGSLLEWLYTYKPDLFEKLRSLVKRGQVEVLGGGFYEPIMVMLPERDRLRQIHTYSHWLKDRLGVEVRGIWLAERVWEQSLVRSLRNAGIEYTVVDDSHFKHAGLEEEELDGYFLTEDVGEILKIFPASEHLRYCIPFENPEKTLYHLRQLGQRRENALAVYADDGEKFGGWPKTFKHVYEDGWLENFFSTLQAQGDWLKLITFSEAVERFSPRGKIYLPDASYREMMEWALPVKGIFQYEEVSHALGGQPWAHLARRFIKGGCWRNFRVKYPEAYQMYARMLEVSKKIASLDRSSEIFLPAEKELHKAQCNDAYWHGIFGGLYLPHLRTAIFRHLLTAETMADSHPKTSLETLDYDLDTKKEVKISNPMINAYFKPERGGHLYELDYKPRAVNLLNTLSRREEAYHRKVLSQKETGEGAGIKSIHELAPRIEEGLKEILFYDTYQRESLIDHFFQRSASLKDFANGQILQLGDFLTAPYQPRAEEWADRIILGMERSGSLLQGQEGLPLKVKKRVEVDHLNPVILIAYSIENLSSRTLESSFGVEFNFSMSSGDAPGRYYLLKDETPAGHLALEATFTSQKKISLVDEGLGLRVSLEWNPPCDVWVLPIHTVSQSESGFEKVYQGSTLLLKWNITLEPASTWGTEIRKEIKEVKPL